MFRMFAQHDLIETADASHLVVGKSDSTQDDYLRHHLPQDMMESALLKHVDTSSLSSLNQTCRWFHHATKNELQERKKAFFAWKNSNPMVNGDIHTLFLQMDGSVLVSGMNLSGELGLGHTYGQYFPMLIPNLTNVVQVVAGGKHSLFLLNNGTVLACGDNTFGQLGLGHTTGQSTPKLIEGLTNVKKIAAGNSTSLFLLGDGTVKSCGLKFGTRTQEHELVPKLVADLVNVTQIACGNSHYLFLMNNHQVKSCGANLHGQLGLGHTLTQTNPQLVSDLVDVVKVVARGAQSIFIRKGGVVSVCGNNHKGQLGLGRQKVQVTPYQLPGLKNIIHAAASYNHCLLLTDKGVVFAMGHNGKNKLGLNQGSYDIKKQFTPKQIPGLANVISIDAGGCDSKVLTGNGEVFMYGMNYDNTYSVLGSDNIPVSAYTSLFSAEDVSLGYPSRLVNEPARHFGGCTLI